MEFGRFMVRLVAVLWLCIYASAKAENMRYSMSCENGVCYRPDDDGPCVIDNNKPRLFRWEPIRKGYTRELELEPGKKYKMTTVANKPPIFEIRNFLSPEECEYIKKLAVDKGLHTSITHFDESLIEKKKNIEGHAEGAASSFGSWDKNKDLYITKDEFIHFAERYKYLYMTEEDVENMIKKLKIKQIDDGVVTFEEFSTFPTASIDSYMNVLKEHHPRHKERYSNQAWIPHGKAADPMIRRLRERIKTLTRLPEEVIRGSEPLQVVRYEKDGHYNGHYDSQSITAHSPEFKCCHTTVATPKHCRLCRYATVLYYLNDVEEGGETAFPAADNETYSEEELVKNVTGDAFNLLQNCHKARLVVPPEQGKAILWYNHFVDEDSGFLGERDDYTVHGGCGVTKGVKWVANNWITAPDLENIDHQSSFDEEPTA